MDQLIIDEGKRLTVYKDSLDLSTIGIGHLIMESDNIPDGSTISEERCQSLFDHDLTHAIINAEMIFPALESYPEPIQECIINLVFNMGPSRLLGFKKFCAAVKCQNWAEAAAQLKDSAWYGQVGVRAQRIVRTVAGCASA